jgi:hypothetical protein
MKNLIEKLNPKFKQRFNEQAELYEYTFKPVIEDLTANHFVSDIKLNTAMILAHYVFDSSLDVNYIYELFE